MDLKYVLYLSFAVTIIIIIIIQIALSLFKVILTRLTPESFNTVLKC